MCQKNDLNGNAMRQRRRRQRIYEASGDAWLFTHCRECGASITPSFRRGFCARATGKKCRTLFFKKVQVPTLCRLTLLDQALSTAVLQ